MGVDKTSFYTTHYVNTKICYNESRVFFIYEFVVFLIESWFYLKDSQFQISRKTSISAWSIDVLEITHFKEIHPKFPVSAFKNV